MVHGLSENVSVIPYSIPVATHTNMFSLFCTFSASFSSTSAGLITVYFDTSEVSRRQ